MERKSRLRSLLDRFGGNGGYSRKLQELMIRCDVRVSEDLSRGDRCELAKEILQDYEIKMGHPLRGGETLASFGPLFWIETNLGLDVLADLIDRGKVSFYCGEALTGKVVKVGGVEVRETIPQMFRRSAIKQGWNQN